MTKCQRIERARAGCLPSRGQERFDHSSPIEVADHHIRGQGRGVIEAAFQLLNHFAAHEPIRAIDLAVASGIPRATVYRLLHQLIATGAARRDGVRYRPGTDLLSLGAHVTPVHRLREAARRPMAELAAATGAAVSLSATLDGEVVFLERIDAWVPLKFIAEPGTPVPSGTAQARAHAELGRTARVVDAGGVIANLSCVAMALPLGAGAAAAVSRLYRGCARHWARWLPPGRLPPALVGLCRCR